MQQLTSLLKISWFFIDKTGKIKYNIDMFKVKWNNEKEEFVSLKEALQFSKELNCFVTIEGDGMEIVGIFGADSIEDGMCPDGTAYTWMKRRTQ